MVDSDSPRQHRPRTSRALADRLAEVAESMGGNPDSFHDALGTAVAYLELANGETQPCPYCNGELRQHDSTRLKCANRECDGPPYVGWDTAIGLDDPPDDLESPMSGTGDSMTVRQGQHRL